MVRTTPYKRGVKKENIARKELEERGYTVIRAAGSHGPFDLIAWKENEVRAIQVKRTADPKQSFGREIFFLNGVPVPEGWVKELWIWHDYKGWEVIPLTDDLENTKGDYDV